MRAPSLQFTCRFCGMEHRPLRLARQRRAVCSRCGLTLARRSGLGPDAALALGLTGLVLLVPATVLPFAIVSRIGPPRTTTLLEGVAALWQHGMPMLAGWVALCGLLAPALLLVALVGASHPRNQGGHGAVARLFTRLTHALEAWAMPEVYVLAVLVAFVRLEVLADVKMSAGFWCYAVMSVVLMMAWRSFELEPRRHQDVAS